MKKMMMFVTIGATVALLALPAFATNLITISNNNAQDNCTAEAKAASYQEFLKFRKDDQAKAFEAAKKYLGCPTAEVTPDTQKIIDYLKKWSAAYEEGMAKINMTRLLYIDKKYPEAYEAGRAILAKDPENLKVLVDLGANGYVIAPMPSADQLKAEALAHARKALQLIDSGKTVEDWSPLGTKDGATAYLNFTIGTLTLEKEPANALKNLLKAAQLESPLKKSPYTYAYIAAAYETGPYAKQSEDYKTVYGGKDETPESKLALANINQLVDRMIDGYARAVALAGAEAQYAKQKPIWMESLTTWYKYRNATDTALTGMSDLIANVLTKPLPPEPTPLTSLPASTPGATPIGNTTTPTNGNGATGTPASNPAAKPAGTSNTSTKPATTPATTKPASNTNTTPASTKPATPDRPRIR